jgi:hypothetical protein
MMSAVEVKSWVEVIGEEDSELLLSLARAFLHSEGSERVALARAMLDVLANPEAAATRAAAGKTLMQETYSLAAQRNRYIKRLTKLGLL